MDRALLRHTAAVFDAVYNPGIRCCCKRRAARGQSLGRHVHAGVAGGGSSRHLVRREFGGDQITEITETGRPGDAPVLSDRRWDK